MIGPIIIGIVIIIIAYFILSTMPRSPKQAPRLGIKMLGTTASCPNKNFYYNSSENKCKYRTTGKTLGNNPIEIIKHHIAINLWGK